MERTSSAWWRAHGCRFGARHAVDARYAFAAATAEIRRHRRDHAAPLSQFGAAPPSCVARMSQSIAEIGTLAGSR